MVMLDDNGIFVGGDFEDVYSEVILLSFLVKNSKDMTNEAFAKDLFKKMRSVEREINVVELLDSPENYKEVLNKIKGKL